VESESPAPETARAPEVQEELAAVETPVLPPASVSSPPPESPLVERSEFFYAVHAASFRTMRRAREYGAELAEQTGDVARVVVAELGSGRWHRVLLGEFDSRRAARKRAEAIEAEYGLKDLRALRVTRPDEDETIGDPLIARGERE
jgi:hypothetical protein